MDAEDARRLRMNSLFNEGSRITNRIIADLGATHSGIASKNNGEVKPPISHISENPDLDMQMLSEREDRMVQLIDAISNCKTGDNKAKVIALKSQIAELVMQNKWMLSEVHFNTSYTLPRSAMLSHQLFILGSFCIKKSITGNTYTYCYKEPF
jgi:hypothetical protein